MPGFRCEYKTMELNFTKNKDGLIPAIIQDNQTKVVLMLGFMNQEAYQKTIEIGKVTFFSRTKQRLWTKGEESGHFLLVDTIQLDCDQDTLLIQVSPQGPVCHTGSDTCWNESNENPLSFLLHLEEVIKNRKETNSDNSYVAQLFSKGINTIAQKVGEEAVELIIEAKDNNPQLFLDESADLLFHYLILLQAKNFTLKDVVNVLQLREKK
jgi:phosphoribosyl-AMP cyclohydrolase / phosphoribosyl-ATP pyrophosphohydrolase